MRYASIDRVIQRLYTFFIFHCFARIQVNAPPSGMIMVCNGTNVVNSVAYRAPISSIDSLQISLKNNDGTGLDMNGQEWTCTLLVTSSD